MILCVITTTILFCIAFIDILKRNKMQRDLNAQVDELKKLIDKKLYKGDKKS